MKKIVLITGTSSGFGNLTAKTLAAKGYTVYASMRDVRGKNATAAEALSKIPNITTIELDVLQESSIQEAVNTILKKEGRIDVLVNNAGIGSVALFEQFTIAEADKQMETNFWGPVRCMRAVLPSMRKAKSGLIINIASSLGRFAMPFFSYYSAAKHAVEAISESLRAELAMVGIDVAVVEPGAFPGTGFNGNTKNNFPANMELAKEYGELAVNYPTQMIQLLDDMAQKPETQSPQRVADTILEIVESSPRLKFRYVVDQSMGPTLGEYNNYANNMHTGALQVLGLSSLSRYSIL